MSERKIWVVKEFLFGNIQIEFKSQGLLYKVSCMELGTPLKTHSYLHYQTKIIIWEWGRKRERERYIDWWNPIYKPVLRISPPLYVAPSVCASLFCSLYVFAVCVFAPFFLYLPLFFSLPPSPFFLLAEGSLFIEKFEKLLPPFFRSSNDRLMGNFHGPLSFLRAHAIPHSSAFCFVLFLEFSFHRYLAVHVIFSFLF